MQDEIPNIELIDTKVGEDERLLNMMECLFETATEMPALLNEVTNTVCGMLLDIPNPGTRERFTNYLSKKYKVSKKIFASTLKYLSGIRRAEEANKAKDEIDTYEQDAKGWYEKDNCYWFYTDTAHDIKVSNFTIEPLFHIYAKIDNKRLVRITNYLGENSILDIPSKNFISVDQFSQYVFNEGNFLFKGNKGHYMRILEHISGGFPVCEELKTLGWVKEGFYAFANGIWADGQFQPVDKYGVTTFKDKNYYTAAFSTIYKNVREDDDDYENDRYFVWKQAGCDFGQWSNLMISCYGDNGKIGIAFTIASIFRDLIFAKDKSFPHLFLFGEVQSGKSTLAWSLSNFFFLNRKCFNLTNGTAVGFARNLARFCNVIVWLDEYSNEIDPKRVQSLKGAFDGAGEEKGKLTQDNRTKTTQVRGSCCISGQHLPTTDNNALFTRAMLLTFSLRKFTPEEMADYDTLKTLETNGISSLIGDILPYREMFEKRYSIEFSIIMGKLKLDMTKSGLMFDERLTHNYSCLLTVIYLLENDDHPLAVNFKYADFYEMVKKMLTTQATQISSSESVAGFWQTVEFLLDEKRIEANNDFKIDTINSINVRLKDESQKDVIFKVPTKVVFLRLTRIHGLYMEKTRQQTGKNGIDLLSITHFLKNNKAYIGYCKEVRYDSTVSTGYVFRYGTDDLNVNLERTMKVPYAPYVPLAEKEPEKPIVIPIVEPEPELPF